MFSRQVILTVLKSIKFLGVFLLKGLKLIYGGPDSNCVEHSDKGNS